MTSDQRRAIASVWQRTMRTVKDPETRGLAWIAAGRLIEAERATGSDLLLSSPMASKLSGLANHGQPEVRACAALGWALALRGKVASLGAQDAQTQARRSFANALERGPGGPAYAGAFAIALALLRDRTDARHMMPTLEDGGAPDVVRGDCAIGLGMLGCNERRVRRAMTTALWDQSAPELRLDAALALSFLPRGPEARIMLKELDRSQSQWMLAQLAGALGRLGDLGVIDPLLALASRKDQGDHTRGLAVASIGILLDPEARPSLHRLTMDAPYPANTSALAEAFSIL